MSNPSYPEWIECLIHKWWHPPDVKCKDCEREKNPDIVSQDATHEEKLTDAEYIRSITRGLVGYDRVEEIAKRLDAMPVWAEPPTPPKKYPHLHHLDLTLYDGVHGEVALDGMKLYCTGIDVHARLNAVHTATICVNVGSATIRGHVEPSIRADIMTAKEITIEDREPIPTLEDLSAELKEYCEAEGLPAMSADELILSEFASDDHRRWLKVFIYQWDRAMKHDAPDDPDSMVVV